MQNLNEIIDFYLANDTNYGIMITGDWGVGKTYYFKNTLQDQIKNTATINDNSKKYKPVLISLFGLKSIQEIQSEIFLSLYPILKNKTLKLGASLGKALFKGFMHLKNLGDYTEFISDIEVKKEEWLDFSELVVCFDDFERLSSELNIEELVGYINSLVENESVKVLILANEDKIDKGDYHVLKEKIISNTIEFTQDINMVYDNIIIKKFAGYSKYLLFLQTNKDKILEIFQLGSNNLRTLSFILNYLQTIYSSYFKELNSADILVEHEHKIFEKIIRFTIAISIEYKKGQISLKDMKDLNANNFIDLVDFSIILQNNGIPKEKNENEKSFREKFKEKYFKEQEYYYFKSICEFITGGKIISGTDLIIELKSSLHIDIKSNNILPEYKIYNSLGYPDVFKLSDKEYRTLTSTMMKHCDNGEYNINEYLTIFYFASRFENPLNYKINNLEKRVIKGLKKGKQNYSYYPSLDFHLSVESGTLYEENKIRIINESNLINKEILNSYNEKKHKKIEQIYKIDFEEFISEILNDSSKTEPIFKEFNVQKFHQFFINSTGEVQWKIIRAFGIRYSDHFYSGLKSEKIFFNKLSALIDKKCSSLKSGVRYTIYKEFKKVLDKANKRFSEIE